MRWIARGTSFQNVNMDIGPGWKGNWHQRIDISTSNGPDKHSIPPSKIGRPVQESIMYSIQQYRYYCYRCLSEPEDIRDGLFVIKREIYNKGSPSSPDFWIKYQKDGAGGPKMPQEEKIVE